MADRIQQRRDTAARWAQYNPILLEGEVGYVTDNPNQYKIGDGVHTWNELPFRGFDGTLVHTFGTSETTVMSQKSITDLVGLGYIYMGMATPETNPGTPKGNVFYIASQAGVYTHFNGVKINDSTEMGVIKRKIGGDWVYEDVVHNITDYSAALINTAHKRGIIKYNACLETSKARIVGDTVYFRSYVFEVEVGSKVVINIEGDSSCGFFDKFPAIGDVSKSGIIRDKIIPSAPGKFLIVNVHNTYSGVISIAKQREDYLEAEKIAEQNTFNRKGITKADIILDTSLIKISDEISLYNSYVFRVNVGDEVEFIYNSSSAPVIGFFSEYPRIGDAPISGEIKRELYIEKSLGNYIVVCVPNNAHTDVFMVLNETKDKECTEKLMRPVFSDNLYRGASQIINGSVKYPNVELGTPNIFMAKIPLKQNTKYAVKNFLLTFFNLSVADGRGNSFAGYSVYSTGNKHSSSKSQNIGVNITLEDGETGSGTLVFTTPNSYKRPYLYINVLQVVNEEVFDDLTNDICVYEYTESGNYVPQRFIINGDIVSPLRFGEQALSKNRCDINTLYQRGLYFSGLIVDTTDICVTRNITTFDSYVFRVPKNTNIRVNAGNKIFALFQKYPEVGDKPLSGVIRKNIFNTGEAEFLLCDVHKSGNTNVTIETIVDSEGGSTSETKKKVCLLFIGNSVNQDHVMYLPWVLSKLYGDSIDYEIHNFYIGSYTIKSYVENVITGVKGAEIYSVSNNSPKWTNTAGNKLGDVLASRKWDVISMQGYFNNGSMGPEDVTKFPQLLNYFRENAPRGFHLGLLMHQTYNESVWKEIINGHAEMIKNNPVGILFPAGLATYYAMKSGMEKSFLTPDNIHNNEGLPCLMGAYVIAGVLSKWLALPNIIVNSKSRITDEEWKILNTGGQNGTFQQGDEAQWVMAQDSAIKAINAGEGLLGKCQEEMINGIQ